MRCFVRVHGESFDPLKAENDFDTRLMRTLLDYEGGTPNWSYRNGCNIAFFVTRRKQKISFIAKIAIALLLGVTAGLLLRGSSAAASVYALLFTQLGLPAEALVLMISVNAFLEFVMVAVNMYCLQGEIVFQARDVE